VSGPAISSQRLSASAAITRDDADPQSGIIIEKIQRGIQGRGHLPVDRVTLLSPLHTHDEFARAFRC
jgi:hypothetical protein